MNLFLFVFFSLWNLFVYLLFPIIGGGDGLTSIVVAVSVLATTPCWSLLHDMMHRSFSQEKGVNELAGRFLSILLWIPFGPIRLGHLLHHRLNRSELDRSEVMAPGDGIVYRLLYYVRLVIGLYLMEMASVFLVFLPENRIVSFAERLARGNERHRRILVSNLKKEFSQNLLSRARIDAIAILSLAIGSFLLYGENWFVLVLILAGRGFLLSVQDNSYHYNTPLDDFRYGKNLRLSPFLQVLMLNFNLHRIHHRFPRLPWYVLAKKFKATGESYDGDYFCALFEQFRGPIPVSWLMKSEKR